MPWPNYSSVVDLALARVRPPEIWLAAGIDFLWKSNYLVGCHIKEHTHLYLYPYYIGLVPR